MFDSTQEISVFKGFETQLSLIVANDTLACIKYETINVPVQYNASSMPNFTWYDSRDELIAFNKEVKKISTYNVFINSTHVTLQIDGVGYQHIGNFTLNAECKEESKNISIHVAVEGIK